MPLSVRGHAANTDFDSLRCPFRGLRKATG
jgi:hypothetical protein